MANKSPTHYLCTVKLSLLYLYKFLRYKNFKNKLFCGTPCTFNASRIRTHVLTVGRLVHYATDIQNELANLQIINKKRKTGDVPTGPAPRGGIPGPCPPK